MHKNAGKYYINIFSIKIVAYAWDEPTQPHHITLSVPGGSSSTYNLDILKDGDKLCYENFIYIAFTGTFKPDGLPGGEELVLDVPSENNGQRVYLKRKEAGKRSQLWRMNVEGYLIHEGELNKTFRNFEDKNTYIT